MNFRNNFTLILNSNLLSMVYNPCWWSEWFEICRCGYLIWFLFLISFTVTVKENTC